MLKPEHIKDGIVEITMKKTNRVLRFKLMKEATEILVMKKEELLTLAFNQGYRLQKHEPELAVNISKAFSDSGHPYANGFIGGWQ